MNTITMSTCFKVSPQAPTGADSRAAGVFTATFPSTGFIAELSKLPKTMADPVSFKLSKTCLLLYWGFNF